MSEDYNIIFKNHSKIIDTEYIASLTNWAISNGSKYLGYWSYVKGDELKISLRAAVNEILQGGSISFLIHDHDDFNNDFDIRYDGRQFSISSDYANFYTHKFTIFMLKMIKKAYYDLKPEKVYGAFFLVREEQTKKKDYISWINIFSPKIVRKLGKDLLLSVKAYKVEEMEDGGIMILLTDNPMEASEQMCEEISKYVFKNEK